MFMSLPGGGLGRICIKRDTYPDGSDFVGRGIVPTLLVKQTVEDVRNGSDAVLDRALSTLSN
jgi:C-terminal processing protease CtpA/Prc